MAVVPNRIDIAAKNKVGVLVGFACSGRPVPPEMIVAMAMQPNPTHFSLAHLVVKGLPVDKAREMLAEKAVEIGAKYLWFVDDDTVPPPNSLRRLLYVLENYPEVMAIGGVYVTKTDPPQPVLFRGPGVGSYWKWKKGDIFEVTSIGAGCLLINTKVFETIPKPWFEWQETIMDSSETPYSLVSEDISFCNKVRAAGYMVFAHGGVLCDHVDVATGITYQMPDDSYPMRPETISFANALPPQESTK